MLKKGMLNNEAMQMFVCMQIKTAEWHCYYTTVTYDGIDYTMTNYVYIKETTKPSHKDFTTD